MLPLRLIATGKALPAERVTSAALDLRLGHAQGYVQKRSGVVWRYHAAAHESQSALAAKALHDAVHRAGIRLDSIDLLISAGGIQEQALPGTAVRILHESGLPDGTPAFDVGASCLGFLAALRVAASLLHAGAYRRIAIVASDLASRGLNWAEPEASLIFGDGAAAAVVEAGSGCVGIASCLLETYPAGRELCEIRAGGTRRNPRVGVSEADFLFRMDGKRVFKLASSLMEGFMRRLLDPHGWSIGDIDTVVPHQASHLSMAHMRQRLGIPAASLVDIYAHHGNQVAASMPTALHEALISGRARQGSRLLLLGSAAGLTLGGMVLCI
ncbi:MAG: 3-oxoacyl-[acyl-carrier-protein] synthase III C-terminal domain-containing protein [Xenophilus sp.]